MTIPMHPALKAQLLPLIVEAIQATRVEGKYVNSEALIDLSFKCNEKLTNKKELNGLLERYVGPDPFLWAPYCFIAEKVLAANLPEDAGEQALTELPAFSDPSAVSAELLSTIENLPNKYFCSVALPSKAAAAWKEYGIPAVVAQTIAIVGSWHDVANQFPVVPASFVFAAPGGGALSLSEMFNYEKSAESLPGTLTLHVTVNGLISNLSPGEPADEAIRTLKSFLGLSFASKLCTQTFSFGADPDVEVNFYDVQNIGRRVTRKTLDRGLSELVRSLWFRAASTPDFAQRFKDLFAIIDGNLKSDPLVLAGRWLCDSYANHDKVMAFMQAAIVIEVLLGSGGGEDVGLTSMLANRCAYLLARTTDEREALLKSFPEIYKTRSKIVHTGLGALKAEEIEQFSQLRKLCDRVIQVEMMQLLATRLPPPPTPLLDLKYS
ncbi:MAG: hypothetical protein EON54_13705 [Alcaligenaceae bacterium]|nr:MAG: hypothetical protein EON54_13705 [Alcaligenaceae bacterium]